MPALVQNYPHALVSIKNSQISDKVYCYKYSGYLEYGEEKPKPLILENNDIAEGTQLQREGNYALYRSIGMKNHLSLYLIAVSIFLILGVHCSCKNTNSQESVTEAVSPDHTIT